MSKYPPDRVTDNTEQFYRRRNDELRADVKRLEDSIRDSRTASCYNEEPHEALTWIAVAIIVVHSAGMAALAYFNQ